MIAKSEASVAPDAPAPLGIPSFAITGSLEFGEGTLCGGMLGSGLRGNWGLKEGTPGTSIAGIEFSLLVLTEGLSLAASTGVSGNGAEEVSLEDSCEFDAILVTAVSLCAVGLSSGLTESDEKAAAEPLVDLVLEFPIDVGSPLSK